MFDNYEKFKKDVYALTKIDLNYYKEKQMRRRIDTIATKHGCSNYDEYIRVLKTDKDKFEAFVNFLTINVSEFYRNPDQWKLMDENVIPKLIKQHGKICMCGVQPVRQEMNRILLSWHYPNIFRFPTFILRQPIWTSRFFRKRRLVCTMKRALQMCRRNLNASILNRSENHFRFRMKSSVA